MATPSRTSGSRSASTPAPTRDGVLSLLLRLGDATAADLAEALGVSVQVTRRHLRGFLGPVLPEPVVRRLFTCDSEASCLALLASA